MADPVLYEVREQVAWTSLNRPRALNAVNEAMVLALLAAVAEAAADDRVRVLVLTGAGRAFSAGGDIFEMAAISAADVRSFQGKIQKLSREMRDLDKPILAAVNGYALGAGIELALMCDMRIASQQAVCGVPAAQLGISPGGGMTAILPRVVGRGRMLDLALRTWPIDAKEALRIGLITQIEAAEELIGKVQALGTRLASFPAQGLAFLKRAYYQGGESSFETTLKIEEEYDIGSFRSAETQAALRAFLESRRQRKASQERLPG